MRLLPADRRGPAAHPSSRATVVAAALAVVVTCGPIRPLLAAVDDKRPRKEAWESSFEDPAIKAYAEQVKAGGLDATARDTLLAKALPLLEAPANRQSIERLRKRLRDMMLNERATDPATLESANAAAADWLLGRAVTADLDPVVAVNEVLLVGEMRGADGKPWPGAGPRLAATAANANAPLAVRAAAVAGIARNVEAGLQLPADAAAAIRAIAVGKPAAANAAGDWLTSRALGLLPAAMPKATPDLAVELGTLLGDASRTVDVRVRAAEALGRTATEESKLNAAAALTAVRALAIRGLEEDLDRAQDEAFGQSLAAGGAMAMGGAGFGAAEFAPRPGGEFAGIPPGMGFGPGALAAGVPAAPAVEPTVLEHNAWRLVALANAIQPAGPASKSGGLVAVAGDSAAAARSFAATLRENAAILHEWIHPPKDAKGRRPAGAELGFDAGLAPEMQPTKQDLGQALREALDDLRATPPFGGAAEAGSPPASGQAPAAADPFTTP